MSIVTAGQDYAPIDCRDAVPSPHPLPRGARGPTFQLANEPNRDPALYDNLLRKSVGVLKTLFPPHSSPTHEPLGMELI